MMGRTGLTLCAFLLAASVTWADVPLWKCLKPYCACPNDYCKKPLPCVGPVQTGCCNDYCKKPLPGACAVQLGCCNDYCKKSLPACPSIGSGWWYTCGPCQTCLPR